MDIRVYTDKDYIAINDLRAFGNEFVTKTEEYRRSFMEIIPIDDLNFVNIVETPSLLKKRFMINVELKGVVNFVAENNDFILEIAKMIVKGQEISGISVNDRERLIAKFKDNSNDLTIITEYITKNINKVINNSSNIQGIEYLMPELTKFDLEFIKKYNDLNLNYSINDFQVLTNCSYETGRKSLEKMHELKLYEKTKVGKKFVYKPTTKLKEILKGGN